MSTRKIARAFGAGRVRSATACYDAGGKVIDRSQGTYASENDPARDIDRHTAGG